MLRCLGLAVICGSCLTGCHVARPSQSSPGAGSSAASQEKSADTIELFMAFVERPLGDPFLNKDLEDDADDGACLWSSTDHHVDSIDRQIALEENGFCVGQIVGMVPARLLTLLGSERACVNPRRRLFPSGATTTIHLGQSSPQSTFQIKNAGQSQSFSYEDARFGLDVIARPTRDGRVQLEFTPRVEHRSSAFAFNLAADLQSYEKQVAPPHRSFPMLSWNVTLKPGETLAIGANLEKPGSLGYRSFIEDNLIEPVQRVLVLRASGPVAED